MASTPSSTGRGTALLQTDLPLPGLRRGKVRDVYDLPAAEGREPAVLIVATDRISAFDVVMPTPVPGKGQLLTAVATRWFRWLESQDIIAHHLISTDPADVPGISADQARSLEGRIMIGRACQVIPVECVVRGYLAGSGWNDYEATGTVCGVGLPAGLQRAARLPEPIFTPATKATEGHDENIDFAAASAVAGPADMDRLRSASVEIYRRAAEHAAAAGMLLADTKFEFGRALDDAGEPTGELLIIDEMLTQDSSRYWPADAWRPGEEPASFDKQFVRNHLLDLVAEGRWNRNPPGPALPDDVVAGTLDRYREAAERLFPGVTTGI